MNAAKSSPLGKKHRSNNLLDINEIKSYLRDHPNQLTTSEQEKWAGTLKIIFDEGPTLEKRLTLISSNLGHAQIEVAALGTFVWAFGDLIF